MTNHPAAGLYDSRDPELIRQHIDAAVLAGIDTFAVSWWGRASPEDETLDILLDTARNMGTKLKIAIHFETPGLHAKGGTDGLIDDMAHILKKCAAHPNYLRVRGRPVVFVYNPMLSTHALPELAAVLLTARRAASTVCHRRPRPRQFDRSGRRHLCVRPVFSGCRRETRREFRVGQAGGARQGQDVRRDRLPRVRRPDHPQA